MSVKNTSFQTKETITEQVVKTNKWECGKIIKKSYYEDGEDTLAFTVEGVRENADVCKPLDYISFTVNGTGDYGGERKPIETIMSKQSLRDLQRMITAVLKEMK